MILGINSRKIWAPLLILEYMIVLFHDDHAKANKYYREATAPYLIKLILAAINNSKPITKTDN